MRWAILAAIAFASPLAAQQVDYTPSDWGTFRFERDAGLTSGSVTGGADSVYKALKVILKDVGFTIKEDNPAAGQLGVKRQRIVRKLGKELLSAYMSCGSGLTGPNADNWYVYLTLAVQVVPQGPDRSQMNMSLVGDAVDVPGGRSDRVTCATLGRLELIIVRRLRDVFPGTKQS